MIKISDDNQLIQKALGMAKKAWTPYSGFRVGAAVLLADGTVIGGNNQENRAYPLGSCAERVAVNYARANFPERQIVAILMCLQSLKSRRIMPGALAGASRRTFRSTPT